MKTWGGHQSQEPQTQVTLSSADQGTFFGVNGQTGEPTTKIQVSHIRNALPPYETASCHSPHLTQPHFSRDH